MSRRRGKMAAMMSVFVILCTLFSGAASVSAEVSETAGAAERAERQESAGQAATREAVLHYVRNCRIRAILREEAVKRSHKEAILRSRLFVQLLADGVSVPEDSPVYFVCDNGYDYVAAVCGDATYVYLACITRSGEYFLTSDTVNEAVTARVRDCLGEDTLHTEEAFWNHIMLRDAPQSGAGENQSRPKDANGVMIVPYFNQSAGYLVNGTWMYTDWPSVSFSVNGHTMSQAGCGFFSTAMALSYILQRVIAPVDFKENGQYIAGGGSAVTVGVMSASMYRVPAYITSDIGEVLTALRNGQPVMEHVGSPPFTREGHYILLVGVLPDGTIAVNDPGHAENSYWYCGVSFPLETILAAVKYPETAFTVFG